MSADVHAISCAPVALRETFVGGVRHDSEEGCSSEATKASMSTAAAASNTDQRADEDALGDMASEQEAIEGIVRSVHTALAQLEDLWTDVGVESKERRTACQEIALDVQRTLQAKINDAREAKAQTALKIRVARNRMQAIYMQLGVSAPNTDFACSDDATSADSLGSAPAQRGEDWMGLRMQLEKLENMLAAAEVQRAKRLDVFTSKTAELRELLQEQYGELDAQSHACLELEGETDLSNAREELLVEAIAKGRKARGARARDIKESIAAMRTLWEVLGADEEQQTPEQSLWVELDAEVHSGAVSLQLKPSTTVLKSANERLASLQALEQTRRAHVAELLSSLQLLWSRVKTPLEEQVEYQEKYTGITLQDIEHHEATRMSLAKTLLDMLPGLVAARSQRLEELHKALLENTDPISAIGGSEISVAVLEEIESAVVEAESRLELRQVWYVCMYTLAYIVRDIYVHIYISAGCAGVDRET